MVEATCKPSHKVKEWESLCILGSSMVSIAGMMVNWLILYQSVWPWSAQIKHYFGVHLWEFFWTGLVFESVDSVVDCLSQWTSISECLTRKKDGGTRNPPHTHTFIAAYWWSWGISAQLRLPRWDSHCWLSWFSGFHISTESYHWLINGRS